MDTLFRLVSLQTADQHSSFNSSTHANSSSISSNQNHYQRYHHDSSNYYDCFNSSSYDHHYGQQDQEHYQRQECGTNYHLYMNEDFSSSSSSKHFHGYPHYQPSSSTTTPTRSSAATPTAIPAFEPADLSLLQDLNLDFSSPEPSSSAPTVGASHAPCGGRWASQLLLECAHAVASHDTQRVQQLMWMLNELSSPNGDIDQKVAAYFLQGLFARLTLSGPRTLRTLLAASDRKCSFDSTRRTALRFQELSPWSSFGHVAANGAILEAFLDSGSSSSSGAQKFHILDLSSTFCTQWPTLLEALATRSSDDTPHLSITTVVSSPSSTSTSSSVQKVMKEIGQRMEKFARLMGVPFRFNAIHHDGDLSAIDLDRLDLSEGGDAILAVNCVNALHTISPGGRRRDSFITAVRRLQPRIVTIVDEEADLEVDGGGDDEGETFLKGFKESLRFFTAFFESLEESFPRTSNERLAVERTAGRAVVDLVSCPASGSSERRQTATGWSRRMRTAGFAPVAFSEDVSDDVRALLRRYREGWSIRTADKAEDSGAGTGIFLAWKEHPVVWASAWTA